MADDQQAGDKPQPQQGQPGNNQGQPGNSQPQPGNNQRQPGNNQRQPEGGKPENGQSQPEGGNGDDQEQDKQPTPEEKAAAKKKRIRIFIILALLLLVALIVAFFYWLHARHYETTDDAFVDGYISQVAPQVSGRVGSLLVNDNQEVAAGQILFVIDPADYRVRLDQAKAQLVNAEAQIGVQRAAAAQAQANARMAEANLIKANQDLQRYRTVDPRAISREQLDQAVSTQRSDAATLDAQREAAKSAIAQITAAEASAKQRQADVNAAQLQLSYTEVKASQAGRVTRRTVDVGNYLTSGQVALSVVADEVWVTANFKETQLTLMKAGQRVTIEADAFPDTEIDGHVDSVQSGTGSVFSTLPAENATGNYVKIVQRVPVKIVIDKIRNKDDDDKSQVRLTPGLSVTPRVTVR